MLAVHLLEATPGRAVRADRRIVALGMRCQPRRIVAHDLHLGWKIRYVEMSPMIGFAVGSSTAMRPPSTPFES